MKKYEKIIALPRPASKRQKMSRLERAAQFSPFAALTGFEDEIAELNRETLAEAEFSEEREREINAELNKIAEVLKNGSQAEAAVKYFVKDNLKSGGDYLTEKKIIKRLDAVLKKIRFLDGTSLSFSSIVEIKLTDGR